MFRSDGELIRAFRNGVIAGNVGYRKALQFEDDQFLKVKRDPHDEIMRYYQDYSQATSEPAADDDEKEMVSA